MSTLLGKAENANAEFQDIPVIDLANVTNIDPNVQKALAMEIRDACINVGFFYVTNHGIPESTIQAVLDKAKEFFSLPVDTKMEIENKKTPNFKGYSPLLSGNNNPENAGDMQEGFEFGWEPLDDSEITKDEEKDGVMAEPGIQALQVLNSKKQWINAPPIPGTLVIK
ncbi:hypothetical protein H0H81_004734 [Sphagnurus paluster]|uniref:Non-haem dioxygenase N-terminal domain-containing protein n=1 Tax=Sphagnurus paluster TaxID=117069 RepID=A0A9P7KMZ7_9AGAR|nr:hypothetical protein H0H81_004734 [Sphagnurus paluster]